MIFESDLRMTKVKNAKKQARLEIKNILEWGKQF